MEGHQKQIIMESYWRCYVQGRNFDESNNCS